ncbi:uncharacterized protein LOC132711373 [Pantherophis guttatus]|uniref:Uncharacterized protein LOC132711373 n=1 Tax=Pantherophis guttatus TaxID=94885 RepID=A0ABM3ZCS9_PANGU|nr:uncharacterized protein LOC132711373 [Pantherophis guttatus]
MQGLSFPGSPGQPAVSGQGSEDSEGLSPGLPLPTPGKDGILHRHSSLGPSPLQAPAVVPPPLPETGAGVLPSNCPPSPQSAQVLRLVELGGPPPGEGVQGTAVSGPDYRRQPSQLGGPPFLFPCSRSLDSSGFRAQHKLVGAPGHPPGPSGLCPQGTGQACPRQDGQRGRQSPRKPPRRDPLSTPHGGGRETGLLGGDTPQIFEGSTHLRSPEFSGGLAEQGHSGPRGVVSGPSAFCGDHFPDGVSSPGPFRHTVQSADPEVLFTVSGARSGGSGRSPQRMAPRPSVCLPSTPSHCQSHQEDATGEGGTAAHRPPLAPPALVRGSDGPLGSASMASSSGQSRPPSRVSSSSGHRMATTNRLAIERRLLSSRCLPPSVVATIQAARRPSTTRIYDSTWRAFSSWCDRHSIASTAASTEQVLIYLQDRLDSGLAPNTLRRQVAAISSILCCGSRGSLASRPLIRQFLRGASNLQPAPLHRYPTWDLPRVLDALTRAPFEPLREVGLRFLSYKVAFLLAITSARRVSDLAALSAREDLCIFHPDRVVLRLDPTFLPKINSPYHRALELVLPDFCPHPTHPLERAWHTLDVRRALRIYLRRTSSLRQTEALLVSFQPSSLGRKISAATLGRWIRATIAKAYEVLSIPVPRRITAHSTRSAATSVAWATQASLEEICRAAAWASPTPFIRHYRLDWFASAEAAFGRRVLQQVHLGTSPPSRAGPSLRS